jgi:hypothetical protein
MKYINLLRFAIFILCLVVFVEFCFVLYEGLEGRMYSQEVMLCLAVITLIGAATLTAFLRHFTQKLGDKAIPKRDRLLPPKIE